MLTFYTWVHFLMVSLCYLTFMGQIQLFCNFVGTDGTRAAEVQLASILQKE